MSMEPPTKKVMSLIYLITWSKDSLISCFRNRHPGIADHYAVHCDLRLQKPCAFKKRLTFRKLRSIYLDSLCWDICHSSLCRINPKILNALTQQYYEILRSILKNHAPLKQHVVTTRPSAPWYNQEVALEKNSRRRLERKWRKTKLKWHLERYVLQCSVVNNLIMNLKTTHYMEFIKEHSGEQKVPFATVNKLLQKEVTKRHPPSSNTTNLVNSFADLFTGKIDTFHSTLEEKIVNVGPTGLMSARCHPEFCDFAMVSQDTIKQYTRKSALKRVVQKKFILYLSQWWRTVSIYCCQY